MTSSVTQLPAYIQLRYEENGVFDKLESGIRGVTQDAKQQFSTAFSEIDNIIKKSVNSPRTGSGALDLGVPQLRAAQAAHEANAIAARESGQALRVAAGAGDVYSTEMRQAAVAAKALETSERAASLALRSKADALDAVQRELNQQASATSSVIDASGRFNAANGQIVKGSRAVRQATLQAGQQIQDVGISLYSGQRASVVFAQQLPQLAFALSGLENSANATQARIGKFATFLAGPWGLAVGLGVGVLGALASSLFDSGDAADEATAKTYNFADGLDVLTLTANETTNAMTQLANETRSAIAVQGNFLRSSALVAGQSVSGLEGRIASASAELRSLEKKSEGAAATFLPSLFGPGRGGLERQSELRRQLAGDRAALPTAREAAANASIAISQQSVLEARDPALAARNQYDRAVGRLNRRRDQTIKNADDPLFAATTSGIAISENEYKAEFGRLTSIKEAAEKAGKAGGRATSRERSVRGGGGGSERAAQAAAKETERLSRVSDSAAESILRINEQFDDQPRLVDRSAQAVRKLQSIMDELADPKNADTPRRQELITEAVEAQAVAANAVNAEVDRYIASGEASLQILDLQARGLYDQAELMQEIARLDESLGLSSAADKKRDQVAAIETTLAGEEQTAEARAASETALAGVRAELAGILSLQDKVAVSAAQQLDDERALQREVARTRELLDAQLNVLDTAGEGLRDILSGRSSDLFGDLKQSIADLQGARLFDDLFAGVFEGIEDQLRQKTPLGQATTALEKEVTGASASTANLATATEIAAQRILQASDTIVARANGETPLPGAANDNNLIVVPGSETVGIDPLSSQQIADKIALGIVQPLLEGFDDTFGTGFMQELSGVLQGAVSGYIQGGKVGGVLGLGKGLATEYGNEGLAELFGKGLGGAARGSQINGIAGALGLNLSGTGSQLGGAAGAFLPFPGGDIIGAVAGGLIGKLFGSAKRGSAIIGGAGDELGVNSFYGNNQANKDASGGLASEAIASINRIAERLNAGVDSSAGKVSIGLRDGDYRVDPQGRGYTKKSKFGDILDFGEDAEAAVAAATKNLIEDGVITGIRDSTNRLLRAGDDLEQALQNALDFEDVFTRLKHYKDPVGAALDTLDREFTRLIGLFGDAGASAGEYAQLEELYGIERAQAVKEAGERITGSLKSLFDDLTIGDSGLALRTRQTNAQAEYDPLAARVAAGDVSAYDDYADAARALIDIERQLYGSQEDYFSRLSEVTDLTRTRIDSDSNIASIAENRDSPFDSSGKVKDAIDNQTDRIAGLLEAMVANQVTALRIGSVGQTTTLTTAKVANF